MRDPRWLRFAEEVCNHYGRACRGCGDPDRGLIVHHLRYVDGLEPWDYPMKLMAVFCYECNIGAHQEEYAEAKITGKRWGWLAQQRERNQKHGQTNMDKNIR